MSQVGMLGTLYVCHNSNSGHDWHKGLVSKAYSTQASVRYKQTEIKIETWQDENASQQSSCLAKQLDALMCPQALK